MESPYYLPLVPLPQKMTLKFGKFVLSQDTVILADQRAEKIAQFLQLILRPSTGFPFAISTATYAGKQKNAIILQLDPEQEVGGPEGYLLITDPNFCIICASALEGLFHGIQTLRQLLPPEIESQTLLQKMEWSAPCVEIEDAPRFPWRGYMLDVGRNFFPKEVVKGILDVMALVKMNIFRWHLTEDQGWRIEIKKYPKLMEVGSKRKDTQVKGFWSKKFLGAAHEGYYTQEDVREVVAYAAERFIKVIPEIEMPGHSSAALASYPELSCRQVPFEVPTRFGVKKDVYCAGNDKVFEFLQGILDEVLELFPSDVIHIGGDECPKDRWQECPRCQARIKADGLADEDALQTYFINRIAAYLASKGRRVMGWNEILHDSLKGNIIGQYWKYAPTTLLKHLRGGRKMVISKSTELYLDFDYVLTSLSRCYAYEPVPRELEPQFHQNVLGIETPLWTEWVRDVKRVQVLTYPRLMAVAETGWTPRDKKDIRSLRARLAPFLKRLDIKGIHYTKLEKTEHSRLWGPLRYTHMIIEPKDSAFE